MKDRTALCLEVKTLIDGIPQIHQSRKGYQTFTERKIGVAFLREGEFNSHSQLLKLRDNQKICVGSDERGSFFKERHLTELVEICA